MESSANPPLPKIPPLAGCVGLWVANLVCFFTVIHLPACYTNLKGISGYYDVFGTLALLMHQSPLSWKYS